MALHYIYLACLLASSILGFINLKDLGSRRLALFPWYLLLVFTQEIFTFFYIRENPTYSTALVYNIYTPVNTLFFALFYYRIPFNAPSRKLVAALIALFLAAAIITFIFVQPVTIYNNYLSLAGGFLITFCGILFLLNYFRLDNAAEERKWLPVIWITIGVVAFYPVVNISFALYKYLVAYQARILGVPLYRLIPQVMSIFMYSCFIRAFYLCRKRK